MGAVSTMYPFSCAAVEVPALCSHARMPSRVSYHHRAHELPPRTTSVFASCRMFSKPQCSKSIGSLRPKRGSYPRDAHHSPTFPHATTHVANQRRSFLWDNISVRSLIHETL